MNDSLFDRVWSRKVPFLVVFFFAFTFSYTGLFIADFLPEPVAEESVTEEKEVLTPQTPVESPAEEATSTPEVVIEPLLPVAITLEPFNRTIEILNPTSRAIADLDEALLAGVVRHPDSARLNQDGTVFVLGHSSYLPVVNNKNFQAFNGIQNLKWGDRITITAENGEVFVYEVEKVYRAKATDLTVPIAGTGPRLTLATCNSFGTLDDRYIVEAVLKSTDGTKISSVADASSV